MFKDVIKNLRGYKPSLDDVLLDPGISAITPEQPDPNKRQWVWKYQDGSGDVLALRLAPAPSADNRPPYGRAKLKQVRDYWVKDSENDTTTVIEIDIADVDGVEFTKVMAKKLREDKRAHYFGFLDFTCDKFDLMASVSCLEAPGTPEKPTGLRDSTILTVMMNDGKLTFNPQTREIEGWAQHPYLPELRSGFLRNLADEEAFDEHFPNHPLTRVREHLAGVIGTMTFAPPLKSFLTTAVAEILVSQHDV